MLSVLCVGDLTLLHTSLTTHFVRSTHFVTIGRQVVTECVLRTKCAEMWCQWLVKKLTYRPKRNAVSRHECCNFLNHAWCGGDVGSGYCGCIFRLRKLCYNAPSELH
jgi:hypothetical protein